MVNSIDNAVAKIKSLHDLETQDAWISKRLGAGYAKQLAKIFSKALAELQGGKLYPQVICKKYEESVFEEKLAAAKWRLSDVIPAEFLRPVKRDVLPNPTAFDQVQEFDDLDHRSGLICFGSTGTGKTRAVYNRLLADYAIGNLRNFRAIRMVDLAATIRRLALKSSHELDEYLVELGGDDVDILFIDDFHMAKLTPRFGEELFGLIDRRCSANQSIFVTCMLVSDRLVRKLAGDNPDQIEIAQAIIRRLRDFCEPIDFDFNNL